MMMSSMHHARLDRLETALWDALDDLDLLEKVPMHEDNGDAFKGADIRSSGSREGTGSEVSSKTQQILQPPRSNDGSESHLDVHRLPELVKTILRELLATGSPSSQQEGSAIKRSSLELPSTWEELLAWNRTSHSSFAFPPWIHGVALFDVPPDPATTTARQLEVILHLLTTLQLQRLSLRNANGGPSNVRDAPPAATASPALTLDGMVRSMSPQQLELFRLHEARLRADYERRRRALILRRDLQRQSLVAAADGDDAQTSAKAPSLEHESLNAPLSSAVDNWRHRSIVDLMERLSRPHSSAFHISANAGKQQQQQQQQQREPLRIDDCDVGSATCAEPNTAAYDIGRGRLEGGESRKKAAVWSSTSPPSAPARTGGEGGGLDGRRGDSSKSNRAKPNRPRKSGKNRKEAAEVG